MQYFKIQMYLPTLNQWPEHKAQSLLNCEPIGGEHEGAERRNSDRYLFSTSHSKK